jgi:coenzyme PQQ biosynthesis protein PqqD
MGEALELRPRLSRAVRLRFDVQRARDVLLSPERGLWLNASASQIVRRCTGELTVREITEQVRALCSATQRPPSAQVTEGVLQLLFALEQRCLLRFERPQ